MVDFEQEYNLIRNGNLGYYKHRRGLLKIFGSEAVQFLNGQITNDVAKLEDGEQMLAAFPTLKGRMFAVVRIIRLGEEFFLETEDATRQKVFDNLFRFTYAGDFHVEDISENYQFYSIFGESLEVETKNENIFKFGDDCAVLSDSSTKFETSLEDAVKISDELYEVLRIENGIPKYGVDMDEETVVPEVNLDDLISYQKGCYIGQEVIARIHFRGKPAKQLIGIVFDDGSAESGDEIKTPDDKNAGNVTSVTFSPKLGKTIALAYVRKAYLQEGTELKVGNLVRVSKLPFV